MAVRLSWEDGSGHLLQLRGKGIDGSPGGVRLETCQPIHIGTFVHVQVEQRGLAASGRVKQCVRKGLRYDIGVAFTQTVPWKEDTAPTPTDAG